MKLLFTLTFLSVLLFSRDNPFFPIDGEDDLSLASNVVEHFDALNTQEIVLPDSARVLKKVTLRYQNLDGSLEDKELILNSSLDWHLPVKILQNDLVNTQVEKKINHKSTTENIATKKKKPVKKKKNIQKFKKVYHYKFVTFYQMDRFMQVATSDDLIRKLVLVNPHRIVLDFKRDAIFLTRDKKLNSKFYKVIRLGNHDGYYRVVLELDGKYRYKLLKKSYGYLVEVY